MRRARVLLMMTMLTVTLAGCGGGDEGAGLGGVSIRDGDLVLESSCYRSLEAEAELKDDQIVVTELIGTDGSQNDCASGTIVPLAPGPDVVHEASEARFAMVGDEYRQIDWCGIDQQRCVDFSPAPVAADCSEASLHFATIGHFDGVYPLDVLRCEGRWALVELDVCGGFHGEDGPYCEGGPVRELLVLSGHRWEPTGFDQDLFCPNPQSYGDDVPPWACTE